MGSSKVSHDSYQFATSGLQLTFRDSWCFLTLLFSLLPCLSPSHSVVSLGKSNKEFLAPCLSFSCKCEGSTYSGLILQVARFKGEIWCCTVAQVYPIWSSVLGSTPLLFTQSHSFLYAVWLTKLTSDCHLPDCLGLPLKGYKTQAMNKGIIYWTLSNCNIKLKRKFILL